MHPELALLFDAATREFLVHYAHVCREQGDVAVANNIKARVGAGATAGTTARPAEHLTHHLQASNVLGT